MKVKGNKEVNIRAFEPYRKSNNLKGILKPGFEIEVEEVDGEEITEGEGLNQIRSNKWYKDKNGDFYWSGGFEDLNSRKSESQVIDKFNYLENVVFNRKYLQTRGTGVTIAVLDTGVYKSHGCFNGADMNAMSVYENDVDIVCEKCR
jgi:subtilisin family serine protease